MADCETSKNGMWSFVPDLTASHSPSADWWQESEAHARGAAAFFPPLLNLHPAFASNLKSYDPSHLQSSGKKIKKNPACSCRILCRIWQMLKEDLRTALKSELQRDSVASMLVHVVALDHFLSEDNVTSL